MNNIQQPCPSCGRNLELPRAAIGRLAKCPACEATFTVEAPPPASGAAAEPASPLPRQSPPPTPPGAPTPEAQGNTPYHAPAAETGGYGNEQSPFSRPLTSGTAGPVPPGSSPVNPYRPTYSQGPAVASAGPLSVVPRTIEDIFSPTLAIFGARWGPLVLAFIVVLAATFVAMVVPIFVLAVLAQAMAEWGAVIGALMLIPLGVLFSGYVSVGLARNAIAVARNSPSPMMELLPPLAVVVRFLIGGLVMSLVASLAVGVFVALMVALAIGGGNEALATILGMIGIGIGVVLAMVAYWLLWAWMFIVSDGQATALGSIRAAWTLTLNNKLTSVLLVVIATVLSTAGTSACYVGLLITQPLTNLMFAVAYLLMTNQSIDDPRLTRQAYQQPPTPPQPSF